MPRALVLGGTGLVGRATALRLLGSGWQVDVVGRDSARVSPELTSAGAQFIAADRADQGQLRAALGAGADLLVDCLCFTAADARSLLPLAANSGSTVLISSRAVYADAEGNHVNSDVPPHFAAPITEDQPTLAPTTDIDYRSREGYGANKVAAEQVVLESGLPVSVVRASQIHGVGASPAREWAVVKRVLDGRTALLLARRGSGASTPPPPRISPRSSRPSPTGPARASSTPPIRTRPARWRSAGPSPGTWATSGRRSCWTTPRLPGSAVRPGTPRIRSSSTPPPPRHSATRRPVPTRPRSRPPWTGWWTRHATANPRRRRLLRGVLRLRGRGRVSREAGRAARAMTGRGGPPHGWKRHRPSERTSTLPSLTRMAVSSSMK